ncbi:MAG: tRNA (adenosine(37)-N6)-threonylcarbamoyltransferase complex transferase subunit TsaD [Kiritimatiellaeota bacterium]|nr:tRNA (adenosine(37)-N6)-threonylcarbamoyltransferase complex transferase subunit TsaD [Kiritimatiellota bacterium]
MGRRKSVWFTMKLLGLETSCDETAAAVVEDGYTVRSSVIASQIEQHAGYGGVIPELAAREHLRAVDPVVSAALTEGDCASSAPVAVAVTTVPGLIPALLVGVSYARGLAAAYGVPFLGMNHFLAHVYGAFLGAPALLEDPATYPLLALVVSGGHTALLLIQQDGTAEIVGRTLDDAAGEAFDKVAKVLGLGYPGGPVIDRLAARGNPESIRFPRGLTGGGGRRLRERDRFNFSFSGLKTALLYHVRDRGLTRDHDLPDIAAAFQRAVVDVLVLKTFWAAEKFGAASVVLCGGVACNRELRGSMTRAGNAAGIPVIVAEPRYCTDNAAMVAGLAYHYFFHGVPGAGESVSARLPAAVGRLPFAPGFHRPRAESVPGT